MSVVLSADLSLGLLVLAGGRSSRMGQDKAGLPWQGGTLLSSLLCRSLAVPFSEIIISANRPPDLRALPSSLQERIRITADRFTDCGPLGGMEAGLRAGSCDWYLVLSTDLPFYDFSPLSDWCAMLHTTPPAKLPQVILPVVNGTEEPLAALYSRRILPAVQKALRTRDYRVRHIYAACLIRRVESSGHALIYMNVNTPSAYKDARARAVNLKRRVPVVTIAAGQSHAGKTTCIVTLIRELTRRGCTVGYIKSTHHTELAEKAGSDTWRAIQAGAAAVRLCGPPGTLNSHKKSQQLLALAQTLPVDIAFIESRRHGVFPILEVCRRGYDRLPEPDPHIVAVINDDIPSDSLSLRHFKTVQIDALVSYIIFLTQESPSHFF